MSAPILTMNEGNSLDPEIPQTKEGQLASFGMMVQVRVYIDSGLFLTWVTKAANVDDVSQI
jgi:IS5 family transposase